MCLRPWYELTHSFVQLDLWFNFFHQGRFFANLASQRTAPHILFCVLAHVTLFTEGNAKGGQLRALYYAQEARKMIDCSLKMGCREIALVQSAVLLAAFELQPHVHQSLSRAIAAWSFVESCASICIPPFVEGERTSTADLMESAAIEAAELRRLDWTFSQLSASLTIWDCLLGGTRRHPLPSLSRVRYSRATQLMASRRFSLEEERNLP